MRVLPLARYLRDQSAAPARIAGEGPEPVHPVHLDRKAEIDGAFARGREEGLASAARERSEALKVAEERHAHHLAEERDRWASTEGAKLAVALEQGLMRIEDRLAEAAAQLLRPIAIGDAQERMLAALRQQLLQIREKSPGIAMSISGPADLIEALRRTLAVSEGIAFATADVAELRVEIDDTVIETNLAKWRDRLTESMA